MADGLDCTEKAAEWDTKLMESPISFKAEKEKLIEAERIGVAEHMAIEVRSKFAKLFGGKSKVTVSPRLAVNFSKFLNLVLAVDTKQFKFCRYAKLDSW